MVGALTSRGGAVRSAARGFFADGPGGGGNESLAGRGRDLVKGGCCVRPPLIRCFAAARRFGGDSSFASAEGFVIRRAA